jgi:hemoglobin-like flavoprotein
LPNSKTFDYPFSSVSHVPTELFSFSPHRINWVTNIERFVESVERCRTSDQFFSDFYTRFLSTDPEIGRRFAHVDWNHQRLALDRSLTMIALASQGNREALHELSRLAQTHCRDDRDIKPDWYPLWLDCMLATAADCDEQWSDEVAQAWRAILGYAIEFMIRRY